MFKTTFTKMIDSVSEAQSNFVNTYFVDSFKEPTLAYVDSSASMAKGMVESVDAYVTETTETVKKAFKL
jgi:hypothetical protein